MQCGCPVSSTATGAANPAAGATASCCSAGTGTAPDGKPFSQKKGVVALIFVLLLGGFGAHRFYVGRIGSAIAMILMVFFGYGLIIENYIRVLSFNALGGIESVPEFSPEGMLRMLVGILILMGFFVWWLVDLIKICCSTFRDNQGLCVKL